MTVNNIEIVNRFSLFAKYIFKLASCYILLNAIYKNKNNNIVLFNG